MIQIVLIYIQLYDIIGGLCRNVRRQSIGRGTCGSVVILTFGCLHYFKNLVREFYTSALRIVLLECWLASLGESKPLGFF